MSSPLARARRIVTGMLLVAVTGLGVMATRRAPAAPDPATAIDPHNDHLPRHGGLVLMNGDTHFEVVAAADGRVEVYFSNAVRMPLPPTAVVGVVITVLRQGAPDETVELTADPTRGSWVGQLEPISHTAIVRVMYMAGEPFSIDVPYSGWPGVSAAGSS